MSKMFGQLWREPFREINICLAYSYFAIVNTTIFPIDDIFVTVCHGTGQSFNSAIPNLAA